MSRKYPTDRELIGIVIAGAPGASDELVDRFSNFVWSILKRDLRMPLDVAEDLHQEIFLRLIDDSCRRLQSWSGEGSFVNYLGPIVRNLANDYFRRPAGRREVPIDRNNDDDDDSYPLPALVCGDPSPEDEAEAAEQRQLLRHAMAGLSLRYREIISLRHLEELSYREIAEQMDYKISSVGVILSRAEKRLKEAVDRQIKDRQLASIYN